MGSEVGETDPVGSLLGRLRQGARDLPCSRHQGEALVTEFGHHEEVSPLEAQTFSSDVEPFHPARAW